MKKIIFATAIFWFFGVQTTHARSWETIIQDDIFTGKKTAEMIGQVSWQEMLYFSCDGDRRITMAVIFVSEMESGMKGAKAETAIRIDNGNVHKFNSTLYQHNPEMLGFGSTSASLVEVVRQIRDARNQILVGVEITSIDSRFSLTAPVDGSTPAANRFIQACEIEAVN